MGREKSEAVVGGVLSADTEIPSDEEGPGRPRGRPGLCRTQTQGLEMTARKKGWPAGSMSWSVAYPGQPGWAGSPPGTHRV